MAERTFLIAQTVEMHAENDVYRYDQPFEYGDGGAHEWRVKVRRSGKAADLSGFEAKCFITRAANALEKQSGAASVTVMMEAQIDATAGEISCVLSDLCYGGIGAVSGTMTLEGEDGQSTTVARMSARTGKTHGGAMADPDGLMMSLDEIEAAAREARAASEAAGELLESVRAEQAGWIGASAVAETLAAGSAAEVVLAKNADGKYVFRFRIPRGATGKTGATGPQGPAGASYTLTAADKAEIAGMIQGGGSGYTPVKGVDYWTEEDKAEIKAYVDDAILGGAW